MKKTLIAVVLTTCSSTGAWAESYNIDPTHTYPSFSISHLGYSTMRGRFDKNEGSLELDRVKKTASVSITIDAASINTGFGKRDDHLRSNDFLNVAEFPKITFKSTKVSFSGDMPSKVMGDLTIMGVTKNITLEITGSKCAPHPMPQMKGKEVCGFDAKGAIKRSDFGIKYGLPAIGDDMELTFEVEAVKKG